MAALIVRGTLAQSKQQYTVASLTGAETITASVPAGNVALVLDSTIPARSLNVDVIAKRLAEALREAGYAA